MNNYLTENLSFVELETKLTFFRKIKSLTKSERLDEYFPNSSPNVLKQVFSSIIETFGS